MICPGIFDPDDPRYSCDCHLAPDPEPSRAPGEPLLEPEEDVTW